MILSEFFNNSSLKSLLYVDSDWLSFGLDELASNTLHFIVTIPYYISKFLALIVDTAIDKLYSLNLLNQAIGNIFSVGTTLWNEFFSLFGILFFGITLFWVIKDYYMGSVQKAIIRLLTFFVLLGFGNGFFTNGSDWIKGFNNFSGTAQVTLTDAVSSNISNLDNELITELGGSSDVGPTDSIRNSFYTMAVLKPFALINFGKSDIKASTYKKFLITEKEDEEKRTKKIEKAVKKEVTKEKNNYMSTSTFFEKFFIGLTSLLNTVVLGGIVLAISFLNPLLQLLVLLLILIMPILMIISLLPNMGKISYNGMLLLIKALGTKLILGVAFGMMFTLFDVIDAFFTGNSINYYMLGFILKAAFIIIGWKKRYELTQLFQGKTTSLSDLSPHKEAINLVSSMSDGFNFSDKSESFKNELQEGREWSNPTEFDDQASDVILASNTEEYMNSRNDEPTIFKDEINKDDSFEKEDVMKESNQFETDNYENDIEVSEEDKPKTMPTVIEDKLDRGELAQSKTLNTSDFSEDEKLDVEDSALIIEDDQLSDISMDQAVSETVDESIGDSTKLDQSLDKTFIDSEITTIQNVEDDTGKDEQSIQLDSIESDAIKYDSNNSEPIEQGNETEKNVTKLDDVIYTANDLEYSNKKEVVLDNNSKFSEDDGEKLVNEPVAREPLTFDEAMRSNRLDSEVSNDENKIDSLDSGNDVIKSGVNGVNSSSIKLPNLTETKDESMFIEKIDGSIKQKNLDTVINQSLIKTDEPIEDVYSDD